MCDSGTHLAHTLKTIFKKRLYLAYCHMWKIEDGLIQFLETGGVFLSFSFLIDSSLSTF